jgi:peptide/nickel transport system substrate-binding protein
MLRVVTALTLLALLFASPTTQAQEVRSQPRPGGTLRYARNIDAKTLDPHFSVQFSERYVLYTVFNTLVGLDKDFNVVPELAESWTTSADGKAITFNLRRGVKFHDGTDFNAEAVKWNIERILNPETRSPLRSLIGPYIDAVVVVDAARVRFDLKAPFRPLLSALAERPGFMVSPAAARRFGGDFGRNPVGTGPFRFAEWIPDQRIVVQRFDGYWERGKPYLNRIEFRHVPEQQVQLTALRTGEADLLDEISPTLLPVVRAAPNVKVIEHASSRFVAWQWDLDKPPFNNAKLRAALAHAVDRDEVRKVVFANTGRVATHPEGGGWWYNPELDRLGYHYDPQRAKGLLTEAGYPGGFTHTMVLPDDQFWKELAQVLQAQLARVGARVNFELVNPADWYRMVVEDKINWTPTRWAPRADPHGRLSILFHSKGFANTTGYSNARVDELIDRAATIYDKKTAKGLYKEVERLVMADAPYVYLVWPSEFAAMQQKVQGFVWIPDLILRLRDLWLSP